MDIYVQYQVYRAMYASDTGLGITLQCHCSLVPRLLPGRKTGREPGRSDHVPCDILCVVCVILIIKLLPMQSMGQRGAQHVEITGLNDKRMITAVFCGTLTGDFLPIQLVYQGKMDRCHPKYNFLEDWHITHSPNHWSTEETMKDYLDHVVFPYIDGVCASCGLSHDYPGLVIFDNFKGQVTDDILQLLEDHNVHSVRLPANCTDCLQPMDISVNKAAKDFIRQKFNDWYLEKVAEQLGDGANFDQ